MEATEINGNFELTKIVHESGLQLTEAEEIKQSYLPYFDQLAEIKEQSLKINFENPTELDEKIARDLRLKTVKVRTGSESIKDNRKKIHLLKSNAEQASWNLIKATCQLDEERFFQVEKKREIEEKKRIEILRSERIVLLEDLCDTSLYIKVVGEMPDDAFNEMLSGFILGKKHKEDEERRMIEEKIAKEKAEIEDRKRIADENAKLKAEAEAKEKQLQAERAKAEAERKAVEEKHKKELAAKEALRLAEQKKADELLETKRKSAEEKAKKEKAIADAKFKTEREAKEKLEAELLAKQEAERKAYEAKQAELNRLKAEKDKADKAPSKDKLTLLINQFEFPDITSMDFAVFATAQEIKIKFEAFKYWAKNEINKL